MGLVRVIVDVEPERVNQIKLLGRYCSPRLHMVVCLARG